MYNTDDTNKVISSILFTCGHDGELDPNDVQERNNPTLEDVPYNCKIEKKRDLNTSEITDQTAWKIYKLTGQQPYTVIEKYHRKYFDVNRPIHCAFEDQEAEPYYYEYHGSIYKSLKDMYIKNKDKSMTFLFDIHGYNRDVTTEADIILGTENGNTVWKLLKNHPDAINDLIKLLQDKCYSVFHATIAPTNPDFDGGYTINHYSCPSFLYACNAIQFEFADELRTVAEKRHKLIDDLGNVLFQFVSKYSI
jgi:N-formylglutamate amidohydrolase